MTENREHTDDYRPRYAGARAVVLGAAGFIGRWVARGLAASGARLFLPVRETVSAAAVFQEFGIGGEIFELDLQDETRFRETMRRVRPDIIFNLAGYGIDRSEQSADLAYLINADLIETICRAAAESCRREWDGQTIIHAGTAMEYGAAGGDLAEDSETAPTTLYGKSKLAGTQNLARGCRLYGLKGLTARLFAVYGPGESSVRLLPTLIKAAGTTEAIDLTEGLHERDFTYVEDAAEGLLRLGLAPAAQGAAVNLATGELTSIRDFAKTAARILRIPDDRLRFGALPTRPEEMRHEPVAIERLRRLTGWSPETAIAKGVEKTVLFERTKSGRFHAI